MASSALSNLAEQMAIDRLSNMMCSLSNLLKEAADTSGQLVKNVKCCLSLCLQ